MTIHPLLTLQTILYVPAFKFNLVFVHKLCEQFHSIHIFSDFACFLQGLSLRKPLVLGEIEAGLYLLHSVHLPADSLHIDNKTSSLLYSSIPTSNVVNVLHSSMSSSTALCDNLWHVRLGHLPLSTIETYSHL